MWPEDLYLLELGRTVFINNMLEWMVIDVALMIGSSVDIATLALSTGGTISSSFRSTVESTTLPSDTKNDLLLIANEYAELAKTRNNILHARPGSVDGHSVLVRWPVKPGEVHIVTIEFLREYLLKAENVNLRLSLIRDHLRNQPLPMRDHIGIT